MLHVTLAAEVLLSNHNQQQQQQQHSRYSNQQQQHSPQRQHTIIRWRGAECCSSRNKQQKTQDALASTTQTSTK
jgi:hypothetical protein